MYLYFHFQLKNGSYITWAACSPLGVRSVPSLLCWLCLQWYWCFDLRVPNNFSLSLFTEDKLFNDCECASYKCSFAAFVSLSLSLPRNLDHHSRPSFPELCSSLKDHSGRDSPSLLDVPVQALQSVREPARAAQLGAPLSCAQDLYRDLQQYYQWM